MSLPLSLLDISQIRADTLGTNTHIHFNNAGSSLVVKPVHDLMMKYLISDSEYGGYETTDLFVEEIENFYKAAARIVNGQEDEIAFIENATRAWDMVFYAFDWQKGDIILTSVDDYSSNMIAYLQVKEKYGVEFKLVPNDISGQLDVDALETMVTDHVKLISVSHIPTNSGLVNPVEKIGAIAKKYNIPFLLDACQSVGQMPIDVQKIGCDMLSTTGRKYIRGPRGTGFLWVKKDWIKKLTPPFLDLHSAPWVAPNEYQILPTAKRFETWERFYAGQVALGAALDYAYNIGLDKIWAQIQTLSQILRSELSALENVTVWDPGQNKCGLVTFTKNNVKAMDAKYKLREKKIHVSVSGTQLTRQDRLEQNITETIRASVHYFNNQDEIAQFIEQVKKL